MQAQAAMERLRVEGIHPSEFHREPTSYSAGGGWFLMFKLVYDILVLLLNHKKSSTL